MIKKHKYQNWLHSHFVPCDWCLLAPDLVIIGFISHIANCISLLFNPIRYSCAGRVGYRGGTCASCKVACLWSRRWSYARSEALPVVYSVAGMASLGRTLPLPVPFFLAMTFLYFMESYHKQVKWNTITGNIYRKVLKKYFVKRWIQ